jgi:5-methyltetrahydrofolate--homocysteine methyltransferase
MEVAMQRRYTNRRFLDALEHKVMVFDGAMGTSLQTMNLSAADFGGEIYNGCNDYLVISKPAAVEQVHRSFMEVGVDVLETCTFRSNRLTLGEYHLAEQTIEINRLAARLARRIADVYSTPHQPRFVAGAMGPSGKLPSMDDPELSNVGFDELVNIYCEQAVGLIEGGVDLLLIETSQDILEVKAAIAGIQKAFAQSGQVVPIQAQVTLDTTGRMLLGTDISAVLTILEGMPIDVIGLNCSTGPDYMREPIRMLSEQSHLPVSCIPNAGLPLNVDGQAVYPLEPGPFAELLTEFVMKNHVRVVGGCCGTTPAHLEKLVSAVGNLNPTVHQVLQVPMLASAVQAQPMLQEPRPFLIGERLNTQGSRKFKEAILADDMDAVLAIARQQMEGGAHGLDVCVALTERANESESMRRVVKVLAPVVRVPFIFDTTEPEVMETALQTAPGRSLLNSTNLEAGRDKADRVFSLASKYNAAVIALTIDEQGMARSAVRKLQVAMRIHDIAVNEHGLKPHDLVFDALTFTLATGDQEYAQSAVETIEGIRLIKQELPGVLTSLGVSNVSFGLGPMAREVINSVMLYHCVQAGLDMAIVNPANIRPYAEIADEDRLIAEDLLFNRQADALQQVITHFDKAGVTQKSRGTSGGIPGELDLEGRLHYRILHRIKENIEADIDGLVVAGNGENRHAAAVKVLNEVLLPAMKEVGDRFGAGELILPFVLQSAEVMKKAITHLETYLERMEGVTKGTLVLATVYGDVHDIGKNLVKTILSNNGYTVIDLGKQVPAETIITRAVEVNATAIGLSALLVSTSKQMPLIVNELHRRGLHYPVLIGGAAINRRFGRRILVTDSGECYAAGVFYCKDAFEGLAIMDALADVQQRGSLMERIWRESDFEQNKAAGTSGAAAPGLRSDVTAAAFIPRPVVWGPRVVHSMPLEAVWQYLSLNELFRLSWGAKNTHGEAWEKLKAGFSERLGSMQRAALTDGWLQPRGMYGCWPAQSDGNDLVLYEPGTLEADSPVELTRFRFPRQTGGENLCLADYFAPQGSGQMDVVAFQVVTVGQQASERFDRLQEAGDYTEAYFTHGLAVQTAEAAAEYLHRHIRRELGLADDQGKRYSWGYPAIPDLEDHQKVFELLPAQSELGMVLTTAYQLVPEQSTAAIIVHHPQAKYYQTGESRIDQLTRA